MKEKFDQWLSELSLGYWGTSQHKMTVTQYFDRRNSEHILLLDLRSREEVDQLSLPFALHIPIDELPDQINKIPQDRLVVTFCSSTTRAVVAWVYLQLNGFPNTRILDASYADLVEELKPGKIYKRLS